MQSSSAEFFFTDYCEPTVQGLFLRFKSVKASVLLVFYLVL